MRVVHPHQYPQQRGGPGQRQRDHAEPGAQHGEADRQTGGQGGVVARERPVPRPRALGDRLGPGAERPARTLLVHHELHRLTHRVGRDGAQPGQYGPGDRSGVLAADRRPPHREQQHPQDHERALGGRLQDGPRPRRCVRQRPRHRPVHGGRSPTSHLYGTGLAQPAGGQPRDRPRSRTQDGRHTEQPSGPDILPRFSFHDPNVEARAVRNPRRTATPAPDDRQD